MKITCGRKNLILKYHRFFYPKALRKARKYFQTFRTIRKFAKSGKLIPDFPSLIQLQTQSSCNGACIICPYPKVYKKLQQGTMDWNLYKEIVDQCAFNKNLKVFCLMLQNEPFLDDRIFKFIEYFKNSGSKAIVSIGTNGTMLTPDVVSKLIDSRLDVLTISLNAHTEKTFEKLSPNFDFKDIMEKVNHLLSHDLGHLFIRISYVVNKYNKNEIKEGVRYWHSKGVESRCVGLSNRCGSLKERYDMLKPNLSKIKGIKSQAIKIFYAECTLPFFNFCILFNGEVILCCNDWERNVILGNVRKNSIAEIFNSAYLGDVRRKIIEGKHREIFHCKHCSF